MLNFGSDFRRGSAQAALQRRACHRAAFAPAWSEAQLAMIKRRPQQPVDALEAASCKEEDDEDGEGRSVASGPRRRAKSCKLCDAKPSDPTPLVSDSPLQLQWGGPTIPWGSGIPGRAVGGYDKICLRTFDAGSFRHEYTTIGAYHTTISKKPEKHEIFEGTRELDRETQREPVGPREYIAVPERSARSQQDNQGRRRAGGPGGGVRGVVRLARGDEG